MKNITTKQYLELKTVDRDDPYEILTVLLQLDENEKNKLLEKSLNKITKQLNRFKITPFDFRASKPFFCRIGLYLYQVPNDLDSIPYGRYLESVKLISNFKGDDQEILIPELISIIYNVKIEKVLNAKAYQIIPVGAFFLRRFSESEEQKRILKERNLNHLILEQELDNLISTNTTIN